MTENRDRRLQELGCCLVLLGVGVIAWLAILAWHYGRRGCRALADWDRRHSGR